MCQIRFGPTKVFFESVLCGLLLCPEATVVWMRGLARLMHSAGFMGFLARPHAEWRRYRTEHLDPWLNNDYVGEIDRAMGEKSKKRKTSREWKVSFSVCLCDKHKKGENVRVCTCQTETYMGREGLRFR